MLARDHTGNILPSIGLEEHEGVLNAHRSYTAPKAVRLDEVSSTLSYVGHAAVGTIDSDSDWRIMKLEKTGNITSTTYADGDENFDNVWNDRASLTYV